MLSHWRLLLGALIALAVLAVLFAVFRPTSVLEERGERSVAVEVSPVRRGALADVRRYSGTLEATAQYTVAPKVGGQIADVAVDIGDVVRSGDTLVTLEGAEYRQAVAEAEAQLAVARAQLTQAQSNDRLASRTAERIASLNAKGIASTAELDDARAEAASQQGALAVARAQIAQAEAALERARVRLGYTEIRADWPGADAQRVVGERLVNPGDTVAANTPLLSIVAVEPLTAVIQVPQDVYATLSIGQSARVRTAGAEQAGYPAEVTRIAPVFDPASRRARVELTVPNPEHQLAPGMFVQVGLTAAQVESAPIVSRTALVERDNQRGVFLVDPATDTARFTPVTVAFINGADAAIAQPDMLSGLVVTLGQAQLEDGLAVSYDAEPVEDETPPPEEPATTNTPAP